MHIIRRRGWEIAEHEVTPEAVVLGRRGLGRIGLGAALASTAAFGTRPAQAQILGLFGGGGTKPVPLAPLTAPRNPRYLPGRALTAEKAATTYNNFYEFGETKDIWQAAQRLKFAPWSIAVDGMVAKPFTIGFEDLVNKTKLEERVYRHRCVEAWAMTVPWTGFPLADLVRLAAPTSAAKYVVLHSLADAKQEPGLHNPMYPWPYIEGLTMAEAANELPFLAIGMYGRQVPPQDGAPIRLLTPWKYGFKSAKSIVRLTFTDKRPQTFWAQLVPSEYGFWANVNPAVPHPRWSQARERLLGTGEMVPTQIWNGYGEFVAHLYDGLKGHRLFA